jgi:hypothetical protein
MNELKSIEDGTYILGLTGIETIVPPIAGYWIGIRSIESTDEAQLGNFIGIWTDPEDGQRYYDVTTYEINLEEALKRGREHDQISIWDIKAGEPIYL